MKKTVKIILISLLSFIFVLGIAFSVFAYYEYYGQYASIINIDGTIKLDAFDVLYPELREDKQTYGCTPENPYVIDSVVRFRNLIRLNNSGKLQRSKEKANIDKYYFCLQFDEQELAQVLNLRDEGVFDSIGNNEYPFVDELSGIVYSNGGNYYSGCLEKITLEDTTTYNGTSYPAGTYYKAPVYNANHEITTYQYVAEATFNQNYTKVHQIIANETIQANDTQMDIGFISRIGATGNVHDLILYNINVNCVEETAGSWFDVLRNILIGANSHTNALEDATTVADERHIGIFAGHIDGSAANISVAGTTNININSTDVNYYSHYTTVGYIDSEAMIGGVKMSALETDAFLNGGSVSGCLFADNIYHAVIDQNKTPNSTNTTSGAKYYKLAEIATDNSVGWQALEGDTFSYGAFTFMLSSRTNDALSTIWQDSDKTKLLLGLTDSQYAAYVINQSVLYCSDEYRFSEDATEGGSIIRSSASVAQGLYAGVRALDNGGSVVDAGKYLIVAKVVDATRTGGYAYYALKLTIDSNGINSFDDSDAIDITNYILDTTGNEKVYQSCVWEVESASSKPIFKNNRWDENYLTITGARTGLDLVETQSSATTFEVNMNEDKFYYTYTDSTTNTRTVYYVNFNVGTKEFSLSTDSDSTIQLYRISNGFSLTQVTQASDIVEAGDYVIVARDATNSYLMGVTYELNTIAGQMQTTNTYTTPKQYATSSFPTSVTLSQYNEMINYIWYVDDTTATGVANFKDKVSMTYYIARNNAQLSLATATTYWTYNGTNGTLKNGNYYINYSGSQFGLSTSTYQLYLYRLVPQDETPLYISYDGAKHLDADSTELKAGEYVIVANDNGNRYPLGLSNATTVDNNGGNSITIGSYSPSNSYLWTISNDTYNPQFVNKQHSNYNLFTNGSALSGSTTNCTWLYDAIESRLYTNVEGADKYLSYDSTNGFVISDSVPTIKIELYKNQIQHNFSNITLLNSTDSTGQNSFVSTTSTNRWYFISYYDITNTNYGPVLVEWNDKDPLDHRTQRTDIQNYDRQWNGSSDNYVMNENPYVSTNTKTYYELSLKQPNNWSSEYSSYYRLTTTAGTAQSHTWQANTWYMHVGNQYILVTTQPSDWETTYSNYYKISRTAAGRYTTWSSNTWYKYCSHTTGALSTTDGNILKAIWGLTVDTFEVNSTTGTMTYDWLYNKYFQDNYAELGFTTATNRYSQSYSNYTHYHLGGYELGKLYLAVDDSMNMRSKAVTTSQSVRIIPNYNSGFLPATASNRLYLEFTASKSDTRYYLHTEKNGDVLSFKTSRNVSMSNSNTPYIYSCSYTTSYILSLISSNGDNLDDTINYVIAAKSGDKYYGLSYDSSSSSEGYTGTDVTTYINPILNAPDERIQATVNVPKNSDWTCVANGSECMFYQTATSTNNTKYYIDSSGTTLNQVSLNTGASTANVLKMYYDTINKTMKCIKNSTTYYLTYNNSTHKFGLSTNSNNKAEIHLFRYDASYSITNITDYDQCLVDGDFIIAAHSVDGWLAIGSNGSSAITTDVTNKLTSTISEADYKSLLDYIFHQYQYSSITELNSAVNSNNVIFKNFNLSDTGSIGYKYNSTTGTMLLVGDAAPYEWNIYKTSSGTWRFINRTVLGSESAGSRAMSFTASNTTSSLTISQNYKALDNYLSMTSTGSSQVAIFNYSNNSLGEQVKADSTGVIDFTLGSQYVILMMNSSKYWSLIGLENNTIKTQVVGKSLDKDIIRGYVNNNLTYVVNAYDRGTNNYGYSLQFMNNTSYYLTGSNQITASTTKAYLEYYYNHVYTDQSKLQKVSKATATGNLNIDGSKITSGGTSTYLFDIATGKIATSLTNGKEYAILIFKDNTYYIVAINNANNIVPITYGSGLPTTYATNEKWYWNGSNFTLSSDHTKYLTMGEDRGLTISNISPVITWSYSGNISGTAAFNNSNSTSTDYKLCLFYVRKSDALSETADVESALNFKAEVESSLSVMDSENYIIVAEVNGRYYALTMKTKDAPVTIDITDDFQNALTNGETISLYDASVWEQLGQDYSLVFSNQGFASKYIANENDYEFNGNDYALYDFTVNGSVITLGSLVTNPVATEQYVMIKNSGGHYYTVEMDNYGVWSLKDYEGNLPTTVLKNELWTYYETQGEVNIMTPVDAIIYLTDYYLLSGDPTERTENDNPKTILYDELPDEMENYTWTIFTYGTNQYVIGNIDSNYDQNYYLYFDFDSYSFQFTTDFDTACDTNKKVQIYRLGEKLENTNNYQTFEIDMNSDGFTIESLPLTEVTETDEVKQYGDTPSTGTITSKVDGEYVIMAKDGENYFALTTDENGQIRLADLSLMFSGNFLIDTNGNYCLSINTKYIWKQTATPSVSGNAISGLTLQNYVYTSVGTLTYSSYSLNLTGITYDLGNHRLYNGSTFLNYTKANGFTLSNSTTGLSIYLYSLGTDGIAVDEHSDILQYTYYSFALNTSAVDYSYFKFNKMLIPDLPNMKLDGENIIVSSRGWKKNSTSNITEINSSVYFKGGITYSTDMDTFQDQFEEVTYDYTLDDESKTEKSVSYYAPKGATSVAITEATPEKPVFVNVVVSTELDDGFDEKLLRYLALWKVANLDAETPTITTMSDFDDSLTNSKKDYAYSLSRKFYTPNAAIPLPNCSVDATKQSSYVKIQTPGDTDSEIYYLKYINYEHLLAHTFTITSPGIYYLGATYGTVTFCYVSIDNMISAEESEDNTTQISEDFSIDFVWGEMGNTGTFGSDTSVGDITYVGRKTQDDASHTWVHSNIYPKFVNGSSTNPTDYLSLEISRTYEVVENVGISTVTVDITTNTAIYDNGKGVMYVNSNSTGQRAKRKVEFNITLDSVSSASTPIIVGKTVVSFGDLAANSIQTVYYKGTAEEWQNITNNAAVQHVYYYSATQPETNPGNYWYFDDSKQPQIWTAA